MENTSYVITIKKRPHSFEVGRASSRHKLYYEEIEDLRKQINALIKLGLLDTSDMPNYKVEQ